MIKGIIDKTSFNGKSENGKMIRIKVENKEKGDFYFVGDCGESVKDISIGDSVLFECSDKAGVGMLTSIKLDDGKTVAEKPKVEKKEVKETKKEEKPVVEKSKVEEKVKVGPKSEGILMQVSETKPDILTLTVQVLNSLQGLVSPDNIEGVIDKIYKKLKSLEK